MALELAIQHLQRADRLAVAGVQFQGPLEGGLRRFGIPDVLGVDLAHAQERADLAALVVQQLGRLLQHGRVDLPVVRGTGQALEVLAQAIVAQVLLEGLQVPEERPLAVAQVALVDFRRLDHQPAAIQGVRGAGDGDVVHRGQAPPVRQAPVQRDQFRRSLEVVMEQRQDLLQVLHRAGRLGQFVPPQSRQLDQQHALFARIGDRPDLAFQRAGQFVHRAELPEEPVQVVPPVLGQVSRPQFALGAVVARVHVQDPPPGVQRGAGVVQLGAVQARQLFQAGDPLGVVGRQLVPALQDFALLLDQLLALVEAFEGLQRFRVPRIDFQDLFPQLDRQRELAQAIRRRHRQVDIHRRPRLGVLQALGLGATQPDQAFEVAPLLVQVLQLFDDVPAFRGQFVDLLVGLQGFQRVGEPGFHQVRLHFAQADAFGGVRRRVDLADQHLRIVGPAAGGLVPRQQRVDRLHVGRIGVQDHLVCGQHLRLGLHLVAVDGDHLQQQLGLARRVIVGDGLQALLVQVGQRRPAFQLRVQALQFRVGFLVARDRLGQGLPVGQFLAGIVELAGRAGQRALHVDLGHPALLGHFAQELLQAQPVAAAGIERPVEVPPLLGMGPGAADGPHVELGPHHVAERLPRQAPGLPRGHAAQLGFAVPAERPVQGLQQGLGLGRLPASGGEFLQQPLRGAFAPLGEGGLKRLLDPGDGGGGFVLDRGQQFRDVHECLLPRCRSKEPYVGRV